MTVKTQRYLMPDLLTLVVGLALIFGSQYLNAVLGLSLLVVGAILSCFGLYAVAKDLLAHAPLMNPETEKKLTELKQNESGVAYTWAVAAGTIIISSVLWFSLSWPAVQIMDFSQSYFGFSSYTTQMIGFARVVVADSDTCSEAVGVQLRCREREADRLGLRSDFRSLHSLFLGNQA